MQDGISHFPAGEVLLAKSDAFPYDGVVRRSRSAGPYSSVWRTRLSVKRGFNMDIQLGDIVKMKKPHPCGSFEWVIERVGMDFKLRCRGCGHLVMIPRRQAEKNIREVRRADAL